MPEAGTRLAFDSFVLSGHPIEAKFDLNEALRSLAHLLQHAYHHPNIAVVLDLAADLPKTTANGRQIENVLFGLFVRSRRAILEARKPWGTITIRTGLKAGKIQFSITDDGIADPVRHAFDASFPATAENSVDLTMCAEIVQDQSGELYAWQPRHSALTTIIMDLPVDN